MFLRRIRACWHLFTTFTWETFHMMYGVWKLARLPEPRVTIFGGSKIEQDHRYAHKAMLLAQKLVENNISVLTGGGPGIMQAANCGALPQSGSNEIRSMGISVKGFKEEVINKCVQDVIFMNYFYSRKWLLISYSEAFIVFPGGFGTLDELAEIFTLVQTQQRRPCPIVLIDVAFWEPLMQWIALSMKEGLLKEEDKNILSVTDDLDEVIQIIKRHHRVVNRHQA